MVKPLKTNKSKWRSRRKKIKQKEIFNKLSDKRLEETTKLDKRVNPDDLVYEYKGPTADTKFNEFDNPINFLDKIREGEISQCKKWSSKI